MSFWGIKILRFFAAQKCMCGILVVWCLPFLLAGCANFVSAEASRGAVLSSAPDAPGYIVIGYTHVEYPSWPKDELGFNTDIRMLVLNERGVSSAIRRHSCPKIFSTSCVPLGTMYRQVLELRPGDWRVTEISETRSEPVYSGTRVMTLTFHPKDFILRVETGKVLYYGDYLLDFNFERRSVNVAKPVHDDAAAAAALSQYPGIAGQMQKRSLIPSAAMAR